MMDVIAWFALPSACRVDVPMKKISLKQLEGITGSEAKLLDGTAVQSIRIVGVVSKAQANVEPVQTDDRSFVEIDFIQVLLDGPGYAKLYRPIAGLLHKLIPHHSVVITQSNEEPLAHLSLATKLINRNDKRLRVVQEHVVSDAMTASVPEAVRQALAFSKADKTNLEHCYRYYLNVLQSYNLVALTEQFKVRPYVQTQAMILAREEIQQYESQINQLKKELKQAQMREKVQLNTEIHALRQRINTLKDQLYENGEN